MTFANDMTENEIDKQLHDTLDASIAKALAIKELFIDLDLLLDKKQTPVNDILMQKFKYLNDIDFSYWFKEED